MDDENVGSAISHLSEGDDEEFGVITRQTGTSWYASVLIVVNAGLGASLLAFPQAYNMAGGIPISLTFLTILALISVGSLIILAYCADEHMTSTYQSTVQACCGVRVNMVCSFVIAIYTFGCSITYLIIIGDLWDKVFDFAIKDNVIRTAWYLGRRFIISITSISIILPLCIPKRIDFLRFASAIGVFGVLYIGVLIVAEYFTPLPPPGEIRTAPVRWTDIFLVLPAICFGYQCHVSAVPVYSCMRDRPNKRQFTLVAALAILTIYLSYVATGVFGYLSFGSRVSADILLDYPPRNEVVAGLALLAIKTYTTYPILHFCGRSATETILRYFLQWSDDRWAHVERRWRYSTTFVWFVLSLVLALFVPDIGVVIGLLGGVAALFIFFFPGLCLLTITLYHNPGELHVWANVKIAIAFAYVVFGTFVFGLTTSQSVYQIVQRFSTHHTAADARPNVHTLLYAGHVH